MIIKGSTLKDKTSKEIAEVIISEVNALVKENKKMVVLVPKEHIDVIKELNGYDVQGFVATDLLYDGNDDIIIEEVSDASYVIAIDGPSASGKSTVAKKVSKILGIDYLDTGAMYRSVTYYLIKNNLEIQNEVIKDVLNDIHIDFKGENVYLNGEDVSDEIRGSEVTNNVSAVSSIPEVREFLVNSQRNIAKGKSTVLDGRDIGTVVFPNADFKFYLTASAEERARRRLKDDKSKLNKSFEEILKDIEERDYKDANRKVSPLKKADDAHLIDSTDMSLEEVVEEIISTIRGYNV